MKKPDKFTVLLLILFLLIILAVKPKAQCSAPNFLATVGYAQYKGMGAEIGYWPQDFRLGGFIGFGYKWPGSTGKLRTENPVSSVYVKMQFRVNRYVYLVGSAGAHQFDEGYLNGGLRLSIPVSGHDDYFRWSVVSEATIGTEGPNLSIGVGYSLER